MDLDKDQIESYTYSQEDRSLDLLEGGMAEALEYWQSLSPDGSVPTWDAFDLTKLPLDLIPRIHIFDAIDGGKDFRCRFWGTAIAEIMGMEMAGKVVSTMHLSKGLATTVQRKMETVISSQNPRSTSSYLMNKHGRFLFQVLLRLPLADKSGDVVHCVTITDFQTDKEQSKMHIDNVDC